MEIATIEIPYRSRRAVFRIWFLGDIHLGSKACDETKLAATLDEIHSDENAIVFLLGDLGEWIPLKEWRYHEEMVAEWVDRTDVATSEKKYIIAKLKPIARKIRGAIQGNHELELQNTWNQNTHKNICEKLNVRNLGSMALVRLRFQWYRRPKTKRANGTESASDSHSLDILLHHGWGGGRTDGADINRLDDLIRDWDCDLVVAGHTHRKWASKSVQHRLNRYGGLDARIRLKARSGTFLQTVIVGATNYSELKALRPVDTGALCVEYCPNKHDLEANI